MTISVPLSLVEQFGGEVAFAARVADFQAALAAHAQTINVPSPLEAPIIEHIARAGGMDFCEIVDDTEPEPEPDNSPESLAAYVNRVRDAKASVVDNFDSDPDSLTKITGRAMRIVADIQDGLTPSDVTWRMSDNSFVVFTPAGFIAAARGINDAIEAIYAASWSIKAEIEAEPPTVTTREQIDAHPAWPDQAEA